MTTSIKSIFTRTCLLILFLITQLGLYATEGMWLPLLLQQLNEAEMQQMGMKMSAEDIYSVNKGSLKDAIVHFGGFCTGEVISDQGLVLTNHHCGYGQIQNHSSLENNYLDNGFWAMNKGEELPNPGLFVTFIVRIEDVTKAIFEGITADTHPKEKEAIIKRNLETVKRDMRRESWQDVMVRDFFAGNQYFLFVTETYTDIRLVGAPPSSIGKFGADTDNWVWPRHTGDFSLFRIYAGPDNKPADYSPDNVPFKPRHYLPVSLDGVAADDFTMVFGFPGRTDEYLPAVAVTQRVEVLNPIRIGIRDKVLGVINEGMRTNPEIRIQYASKQASIANAWKKWIGESQGVKATDGVGRKLRYEAEFAKRLSENTEWTKAYGHILPRFDALYKEIEPYAKTRDYLGEIAGRNIELYALANTLNGLVKLYDEKGAEAVSDRKDRLMAYLDDFFKDYNKDIDQQVFTQLMAIYYDQVHPDHQSPFAIEQFVSAQKNAETLAQIVYSKTSLLQKDKLAKAFETSPEAFVELVRKDYAARLLTEIKAVSDDKVNAAYKRIQDEINELQSLYMKAQMEVFAEKRFYPDANSTLRVTYGQVKGYKPRDAVAYTPVTYLDGVMEKYVPGDYEFDVPEKLRKLYQNKDYGPYAENGQLPICFIGTNHTTGGNSGSPAIDAHGNLIGLNFDRVWEGTMSDINYDASICRNIMVDVRYILFVIDKYAGAGHLVQEMKLVHPKK
ncbi:MAG TPA: S46 family peptidase [Saprospiraceae bacterium]|nr:S46 family peptidase [Saprospiraceae bacterium]HMQ85595.1 S46 family peptidase [Saprospiraceae bacterium]